MGHSFQVPHHSCGASQSISQHGYGCLSDGAASVHCGRGKPYELLSDQGTNFRGGCSELQEAFKSLLPALQTQLAGQQISFKFNPPNAPHFGGSWEREIRSIKSALHTTLGAQSVTEDVLMTVLVEVEGIITPSHWVIRYRRSRSHYSQHAANGAA